MKANKETSLLEFNNPHMSLWFKDKYLKSFSNVEYVSSPSAGIDGYDVVCTLCGLEAFSKRTVEHDKEGKTFSHGAYIKTNGKYFPVYTVEYEDEKVKKILCENESLSIITSDNKGLHYLVSIS